MYFGSGQLQNNKKLNFYSDIDKSFKVHYYHVKKDIFLHRIHLSYRSYPIFFGNLKDKVGLPLD